MNKIELFKEELAFIKNPKIREFAEHAVEILPDYFFSIPASSTGKYHPAYSLGDGGLLRHTKAAVRIAVELARMNWWHFDGDELDLCLVALIIHDGFKSGLMQEAFTKVEHPLIMAQHIQENSYLQEIIPSEQIAFIADCIKTHMGQWCFNSKSGEKVLPVPETKWQKFVHLADYLSSRKCLEMNFDIPIYRDRDGG